MRGHLGSPTLNNMLKLAIFLLIVWAALSVLGFVVKGLMWLGIVCLILFAITAVWGFISGRGSGTRV